MFEQTVVAVFFFMLVGHALGDFALQTEWMVRSKNPRRRARATSERRDLIWIHVLTSHALIHGGAVALAPGSVALGIAETIAHWLIDYGKSNRYYGFHVDQFLHLGCKVIWALCWLAL